ncbi:MAG: hypothetical protein A2X52_08665 [Candidatus Rokubacteria bacterium GWC2_70_16]|nr:MAG: hypothetical protein A2X52_08665 [Candidatus Rokubacteria bacterium GWC2_70_16]
MPSLEARGGRGTLRALFVLTPPESKRLIAKAVARLPEVERARQDGEIVIGHGATNVYVVEEIFGACPDRDRYLSGLIVNRILCVTQAEEKPSMLVWRQGVRVAPAATMDETLRGFGAGSVFVKGANAVDREGNVGILVANPAGGTIGWSYGILSARGCRLIVPVGLEKLVPSVREAARLCGQDTYYYCQGIRVGMIPIMNATVVTEIEAFRILFDLRAVHVGGGGIGDSQGSVVLVAEGEQGALDRAIPLIESIKGEPSLAPTKSACSNCLPTILVHTDEGVRREVKHCMFQGLGEEELPAFIRETG